MRVKNLTPHEVQIVKKEGDVEIVHSFLPCATTARVEAKVVKVGEIYGIPITETQFGEVEGLPDPEEGTIYIVSSLVAQRVPERTDVFVPSESIRDSQGRIIGCRSLGRIK